MGSIRAEVDQLFLALIESGNIRYQCLPAAEVAIAADAAWDQLFAAAGAPSATLPCWLMGFQIGVATGIVADVNWLIDCGWGGVDGAAIAAANIVVASWPLGVTAGAGAVGPSFIPNCMLPFPVKMPPASRMAARIVDTPLGGAIGFTSFRVILATAIGS